MTQQTKEAHFDVFGLKQVANIIHLLIFEMTVSRQCGADSSGK